MPEFTTHYLFGQSVLNDFSPEIVTTIKSNLPAYKWGLRGPDLLFYSIVGRGRGRMAKIGSALHHINPDAIFTNMLKYILSHKDSADYENLCGYFYGFACHYALDSTSHPYVYYLIDKNGGQKVKSTHVQVENEIGSLMYRRLTGMPVSSFKIYENYPAAGTFTTPISEMYVYLTKVLFDKTVSAKEVGSGFSFCLFLNCLTYLLACCELNTKRSTALLKGAKAFIRKFGFLSSLIKKDDVEHDMLNLMHGEWHNISSNQEKTFYYSFPELFDAAKKVAVEIAQKGFDMLKSGAILPFGLNEKFDNGEPVESVRIKSEKTEFKRSIKSRA